MILWSTNVQLFEWNTKINQVACSMKWWPYIKRHKYMCVGANVDLFNKNVLFAFLFIFFSKASHQTIVITMESYQFKEIFLIICEILSTDSKILHISRVASALFIRFWIQNMIELNSNPAECLENTEIFFYFLNR